MIPTASVWLLALALAAAPSKLLSDPEAKRLFAEAQDAFEAEDYAKAADLIERAYFIEPKAQLLYPWAQAERSRGDCRSAIELYQRFIDSGPDQKFVDAAQGNIDRCRETLAASDPDPADPTPATDPVAEPAEDEKAPLAATAEDGNKGRDRSAPRKWYADPAGDTLVALGVAGLATGAALLGVASSQANRIGDAQDDQDYLDRRKHATQLRDGGIAAASIGGALLIAGVVRWALLARKSKRAAMREPTHGFAAGWSRGGAVLGWSARF